MKKKSAATLDKLRAEVDPRVTTRNKVLAHFAALKKAGIEFQTEQQMLREIGLSPVHLRLVKTEFAKHIATVRQLQNGSSTKAKVLQVWFPNVAHAATIRKEQDQIRAAMGRSTNEV